MVDFVFQDGERHPDLFSWQIGHEKRVARGVPQDAVLRSARGKGRSDTLRYNMLCYVLQEVRRGRGATAVPYRTVS